MVRLLLFVFSNLCFAAPPCLPQSQACSQLWQIDKHNNIELFASHSLEKVDLDLEKLVITIHGVLRNASDYYAGMMNAAKLQGVEDKTLIISPHFKSDEEPKMTTELYWTKGNWKYGSVSSNVEENKKVSAYTVMDLLLERINQSRNFPRLKEIVLIGHSAGGQYVSRYSVTGKYHSIIPLHYIISNPSSYLYLSSQRPTSDPEKYATPTTENCPDYDDYAYGLKNRNFYSAQTPASQLVSRFLSRKVTLLLGESDTELEDLDTSCEANLQGKNRWERGNHYYNYIRHSFPNTTLNKTTVPGVGHDSEKMYQSVEGRSLIFN